MANVKLFTLRASAATTAAGTEVGDWVDVDAFHELYLALNVTAFASRADETLDVTVERYSPITTGYVTVATFTQIAATGADEEEKLIHIAVSPYVFGGKIRARCITAGTWSSKSITFEVKGYSKV